MRLFGSTAKRVVDEPIALTPAPRSHYADAYVGQTFLGKYRIRKFIGEGSNAHDPGNDRQRFLTHRLVS